MKERSAADQVLAQERDAHDWEALIAAEAPEAVYDEDDEVLPDEMQTTQTLDCPL